MSAGIIRIGISGWTHAPWRGRFYPTDLRREQELAYAASCFRMLEATTTFYGLHRPDTYRDWAEQVPATFVFTLKAPRLITHVLRLKAAEGAMATFLASGILRLGVHLGPILWQLPANLPFRAETMEAFLRLLPRTHEEAAQLGQHHDATLRAPPWLSVDLQRPLRHALEVRHESFRCPDFIELLRGHNVAAVCADAGGGELLMDLTADFVYCRLQGATPANPPGPADSQGPVDPQDYDSDALERWGARLRAWADGTEPDDTSRIGGKVRRRTRDVFVVFDNVQRSRAPANALELIRRLHP